MVEPFPAPLAPGAATPPARQSWGASSSQQYRAQAIPAPVNAPTSTSSRKIAKATDQRSRQNRRHTAQPS